MGDGSLAFAPQWLKAGHTSLRSGTQGAASSSKEDGNKGVPWRESGSRLGLGAGADREQFEQKQSNNQSRRQGNSFSDRLGPTHPRGGDRPLGGRPANQSRVLSDRELVEQTSSLQIRSGRSKPEANFPADSYSGYKDTFTPRGTPSKGQPRKAPGLQTRGNARAHERDFAPHTRSQSTQPHLSPSSALLSPRQELKSPSASLPIPSHASPIDSPWNTRLADTPHEVPRVLQSVPVVEELRALTQDAGMSTVPAATESTPRPTPRMADAIAQAQANAAQELEAAKAEKARKEQLALRQSKQLVPVLAGSKSKQGLSNSSTSAPGPALLRRTSGIDAPKANATAFITTIRREDESSNGIRKVAKSAQKQAATEPPPVQTGAKPLTRRPSKDKDRLSFFSSLRKSASTDARPESEASSQLSQESTLGSKIAGLQSENSGATQEEQNKNEFPAEAVANGSGLSGHAKSAEPEILAQEVAFMKSLGWDGDIDGDEAEEGGLTEEEIAAFHANKARYSFSAPISVPAKGPDNQNGNSFLCQSKHVKQMSAHSFHSEMEFSDSETE